MSEPNSSGLSFSESTCCRTQLKRKKMKGKTEIQDVLGELRHMLQTDKGSYSCVGYGEDNIIDYMFFQTSEMRENFRKYPEFIGMDTTYKLNKNNMHLVVIQAIDNNKHGRVVGYCFLRRETGDILEETLEILRDANPEACDKIQTIIVDKDYKEINGIKKILPHVEVHLCHTHVMRQFFRHTTKEPHKKEVRKVLKSMSGSGSPEDFDAFYEELTKVASEGFLKYFDENWKTCQEAWILFVRHQSLTIGIRSTNHVESHNSKIKAITRRCMTLGECIRALLLLHGDREYESGYKDYVDIATRRYVANCEDEDVADMMQYLSRWAADELYSQWKEARKLKEEDIDVTMDQNNCECSFFKKFPFKHCMHTIKKCQIDGMFAT